MAAEPNYISGASGLAAVVFNAFGVLFVMGVENAYRPGTLDRWMYNAIQHDEATTWSAGCFAVGAMLLLPWVVGMARALGPYSWPGASMVAGAALLNALGSVFPAVVVHQLPHGEDALGQTLLGLTLVIDSGFNLIFGAGLLLLGLAMARDRHFPMWLAVFGIVAGLPTMGAFSEAWSVTGSNVVALAGPLWLIWVAVASLHLTRMRWDRVQVHVHAADAKRLPLAAPSDASMGA